MYLTTEATECRPLPKAVVALAFEPLLRRQEGRYSRGSVQPVTVVHEYMVIRDDPIQSSKHAELSQEV